MKALVQRVNYAKLEVEGKTVSEIGKGLVVFFCVEAGDEEKLADYYAKKIANLRIFEKDGKMTLSALDLGYEILSVSQFTLAGDCSHGYRPDFTKAEKAERAKHVYEKFCVALSSYGISVKRGIFGADMKITQLNDGPVSIIV